MLHLDGFSLKDSDLLSLLCYQAPNVKDAQLKNMWLTSGRWDTVVEQLRVRGGWQSFRLQPDLVNADQHHWPLPSYGPKSLEGEQEKSLNECGDYICSGRRQSGLLEGTADQKLVANT